ncbi:MAG TPA: hypothetical protein DCY88_07875 [Cyanobacteria bacterium UBA11372]|nr:hypothetical protein [Cyanobacteria bacterium UBA11372]
MKKPYKTWREPRIARKKLAALTTIVVSMSIDFKYKGPIIDGLKPDPFTTLSRKFVKEFGYQDKALLIKIIPLGKADIKEYFWCKSGLYSYSYVLKNLPFFAASIAENLTGVKRQFRFDGISFVEIG